MEIKRIYYLYYLLDPESNIPRYIGISVDPKRRFKDHLKDKANTPKTNWIKSIKEGGKLPILKIVKETPNVLEIKNLEISEIAKYKEKYNLVNSTRGGEIEFEGTPIEEYSLDGEYIDTYNSMSEYCELHDWPIPWATCISAVCLRKRNYTHNRIFRYLGDKVSENDLLNLQQNLHRTDPVPFIIMDLNKNILGRFESFQDAYKQGFGSPSALSHCLREVPGFYSVQGNLICYNEEDFENKMYLYNEGRATTKVSKYDLEGNYIETFRTFTDARKSINLKRDSIKSCCEGLQQQCGGFQWRYGDSRDNIGKYIKPNNRGKEILQFTLEGEFIKKWSSARQASLVLGIDAMGIRKCANGEYKKSGGYKWKYN